ncbi:MAG TPA: hypothetical protein VES42_24900 [Pilimelia sp.]|nr:hypothetical protein [Pilimelia sp.]
MTISVRAGSRVVSDRVAESVSLVDLRMRKMSAELLVPSFTAPLTPTVAVERSMSLTSGHVIYDVSYELSGVDSADTPVFAASLTLNLVFRLAVGADLDRDDLRAFGSVSVLEVAHPYFREIVHGLSGRMGLPPLVLQVAPPAEGSACRR